MRRPSVRLVKVRLLVAIALFAAAPILAQRAALPPTPPVPPGPILAGPSSKPRFAGQVRIAGHIADPGTTVQIVVFRTARVFTICGEAEVRSMADADDSSGYWYDAALTTSPECINPDTRYDFYVNGVWGGAARYKFGASFTVTLVHLAVPEVALRTPVESGMKLFWIYGTVKDRNGRPAPRGTKVTAKSRDGKCSGTAATEDLYWQPKGRNSVPFGALGFYWIAIPMGACTDKSVIFDITAGNSARKQSSANVHTPPYGTSVSANATFDQ